jgi:hypothetical protein
MNHVDQDRTTPGFAAPGTVIEITVGLVEHCGADHGNQAPKPAAPHDGYGFFYDRAMLTMMAGQQFDIGVLRGFTQLLPGLD